MENEEIVWHKFKTAHVAMKGDRILGIVEPAESFPCEAFQVSPVAGLFINLETAKKEIEEGHARYVKNQAEDAAPPKNLYLDILRQLVKALEEKEAVKA